MRSDPLNDKLYFLYIFNFSKIILEKSQTEKVISLLRKRFKKNILSQRMEIQDDGEPDGQRMERRRVGASQ